MSYGLPIVLPVVMLFCVMFFRHWFVRLNMLVVSFLIRVLGVCICGSVVVFCIRFVLSFFFFLYSLF